MKDDIGVGDGAACCLLLEEIAFDELDIEVVDVSAPAAAQVVDHANPRTALEQRLDEVRADERGSPVTNVSLPLQSIEAPGYVQVGFSASRSPRTSTSIFVRRNVSTASSGVQQIGSFSLKLVLSRTGTPVLAPKALIRS